jgi:hypothetical protein
MARARARSGPTENEDGWVEDIRDQCWTLTTFLPDCPNYFVSSEMAAVAREASRTLPTTNLGKLALPSPEGFMVFQGPIATALFADGQLSVLGIAWQTEDTYGHSLPPEDREGKCTCPEDDIDKRCPFADRYQGVEVHALVSHDGYLVPASRCNWEFNTDDPVDPFAYDSSGAYLDSGRAIIATWVLMQQSITQIERTRADRAERRRCARMALPSNLTIIRLRRIEHPESAEDDDSKLVPWSHRWLVSGHWRNQFYPSRSDNSPIWISPHVKGPQDKPLMLKERVMAWVR